ncbi:MAG: hypothetical protein EOP62_10060 [Sphingomonadales bacterium]|nr:MAG: hypothetical protein EOP62_10060 [Sphingomonadales bacterium]
MAVLIGVEQMNGEWDNMVLARLPQTIAGSIDVLGREVPCFRYVRGYDGLTKEEALRVAKTLRGMPRDRRRAAFEALSKNLRLCVQGGTLS